MAIDPFTYTAPKSHNETITFANANGYEWAYLDTLRQIGREPQRVPDGWAFAWLEYTRRNPNRMAIREGFQHWLNYASLPRLS